MARDFKLAPTVNGVHVLAIPYAPGTLTIPTEYAWIQLTHLKLAATDRLTLQGTARFRLTD